MVEDEKGAIAQEQNQDTTYLLHNIDVQIIAEDDSKLIYKCVSIPEPENTWLLMEILQMYHLEQLYSKYSRGFPSLKPIVLDMVFNKWS